MREVEPALRVDADLDLVAERFAQRLDAARVVAHDLDHRLLAAQVVEAGPADLRLQALEAHRHQPPRGFAQLLDVGARHADGGVGLHLVARAAEQLPDRRASALPLMSQIAVSIAEIAQLAYCTCAPPESVQYSTCQMRSLASGSRP